MRTLLVLIVDDDARNRKLARDVLVADGVRTIEASTGNEALTAAFAHSPDIILLDLRLPDLDGAEVARRLKADSKTAAIPVVALTSLTETAGWAAAAGFDGFLEKPLTVAEFPLSVRRLARRPRT